MAGALLADYAGSGSEPEPSIPAPPLFPDVILLAAPDDEVLRCAGHLVTLADWAGYGPPPLTPAEVVQMQRLHRLGLGPSPNGPAIEGPFRCAKDRHGRETGDVLARVKPDGGAWTTRVLEGRRVER